MQSARIVPTNDSSLAFFSPYDPALVADMKTRIPYSDRRWQPEQKCWLITPKHLGTLENLCQEYLGITPTIQGSLFSGKSEKQTKILELKYVGAPKAREDGSITAFAYCDGDWRVIFPESVLRDWFEPGMETRPNESTLYGLLAVKRDASGADIKAAYRRQSKRFHPDVCKDDDAAEMFMKIQRAYEVLSNPMLRRKYEAGLVLAASLREPQYQQYKAVNVWRSPLRSGFVLVDCVPELGRFIVEKIIKWEPIKNQLGQELVTSWNKVTNSIQEEWLYV